MHALCDIQNILQLHGIGAASLMARMGPFAADRTCGERSRGAQRPTLNVMLPSQHKRPPKFLSTYSFGRTLLWDFLSALAWNALIVVAGVTVGMNFGDLSSLVSRYTTAV